MKLLAALTFVVLLSASLTGAQEALIILGIILFGLLIYLGIRALSSRRRRKAREKQREIERKKMSKELEGDPQLKRFLNQQRKRRGLPPLD